MLFCLTCSLAFYQIFSVFTHSNRDMITKLDSSTVQRISSGQLILDIPSTLKELIENAIDAKATQITLTLEDDGLTSVIVLQIKNTHDLVL